ncbi:MAG: hypothetical protein E7050_00505 [Lentisphaerae bacterium]|nr:hypothetical protein [Lentisphaerota bacterium]
MEQRAFKFYNIIPFSPGKEREQAENVIALEKETGIDIALYCLSLHPEGVPADRKVDSRIDSYRKFRDALKGSRIKTGILLQSILGHWPQLDEIREAWTTTVDIEGNTPRFCPLDENFRKYIFRTAALLARENPCFIMGDDDIRSSSPFSECFCEKHTAEFNRRTGKSFTPEEYRLAVKNCRIDDEIFTAYRQLRQDTVNGVCKLIREAIDSVDPAIPGGTCMPDWEQRFNGDASQIIAGKGQAPVMRIANGKFMEESPFDLSFNHLRSQALRDFWSEIPEVLDESDTFPHSLYSKSAIGMHTKLCSSIFAGLNGAKIWHVNCRVKDRMINRKYTLYLKKYQALYQTLTGVLKNARKEGIIIPLHNNFIQWHPDNTKENFLALDNWSNKFFGAYGIPFYGSFSFDSDGIYAIAGKNAVDRLTDEQLQKLMTRKVLLDGFAAQALTERGFSRYTGVKAEKKNFSCDLEISADRKNKYHLFRCQNIPFLSLTDPKAKVITELGHYEFNVPDNVSVTSPGTVIYDNHLGGRICTTAFCHDTLFANAQEERKMWLLNILEKLNGDILPFTAVENQHIMLLHRKLPSNTDILGFFNLGFDSMDNIELRCRRKISKVSFLRGEGCWQELPFEYKDNVLSVPLELRCYENAVLSIE